jgi:hypothetical protein
VPAILVVASTRADGVTPCSFIVGTVSFGRTGKWLISLPTEYVGLAKASSASGDGRPSEDGDLVIGNLNSDKTSVALVGDGRGDPALGVTGSVVAPEGRASKVLLSGG